MQSYKYYNSPRIERVRRLKYRHQRIEDIKTFMKAVLIVATCYGMMWLLIGIVMLIAN